MNGGSSFGLCPSQFEHRPIEDGSRNFGNRSLIEHPTRNRFEQFAKESC